MRRWVAAALVLGAAILTVEGYFVYRFYAGPDTAEVRSPERPAREAEPEPSTRPGTEQRPAVEAAAGVSAPRPVDAGFLTDSEPRPGAGTCGEGQEGCVREPDETRYVREIGEVQSRAVAAFLDSHEKMRRYDGLTAEDVDVMRENRLVLKNLSIRAGELDPPPEHEDQHRVFSSAIADLAQATTIAHELAADPVSATASLTERYDRLGDEAAAGLRRSNELLGSNYETPGDVQDVGA